MVEQQICSWCQEKGQNDFMKVTLEQTDREWMDVFHFPVGHWNFEQTGNVCP